MQNGFSRLIRWGMNRLRSREFSVAERFTSIYGANTFGAAESRSGTGSSLDQTTFIRQQIPPLLERYEVQTLLDAPCGDCHWISRLDWQRVRYHGVDVVEALILQNESRFRRTGMVFLQADICRDPLPKVDLILCRDCWVHLTFRQIRACLQNFQRSGSRHLLTTTFASHAANRDLRVGVIWRPLNLHLAPFHFPPPVELLVEQCTEQGGKYSDKALGLWRLDDLK
jgi:SAM-dependent methyltransferase